MLLKILAVGYSQELEHGATLDELLGHLLTLKDDKDSFPVALLAWKNMLKLHVGSADPRFSPEIIDNVNLKLSKVVNGE